MTRQPRRTTRFGGRNIAVDRATRTALRRIRGTLVVYLLIVVLAGVQLVDIQIVRADEYADLGVRQRERLIELPATRGRIYDRAGDVMATSVAAATIYADPREFLSTGTVRAEGDDRPSSAEVAARLAPLLGMQANEVTERLDRDAHFVYLGRQLDWDTGVAVTELGIDGIGMLTEPKRVYPATGVAAHVVGFTGIDGEGRYGLEAQYDSVLKGQPGTLMLERTPTGLEIASGIRQLEPARPGVDVVLTIDREIQHAAERAVEDVRTQTGAKGASVVVLDVATFEVLAMANAPGFDPNERTAGDNATWRNRALTDVFEPGSSQKALTVAAAIDQGIVTQDTHYSVPDQVRVSTNVFSDVAPHPTMQMSVGQIIERSSNVGTILMAQELGAPALDEYLRRFGYGRRTELDFPGESSGLLMPVDQWWGTSLPTIAIGQGVAVSLTQLATAYAVLANDGVALAPRLVRGTVDHDGRLAPAVADPGERVVDDETARQVRSMLVRAVEGPEATGGLARVPGYTVGGKTGTARKPNEGSPGYSDQYVATFVGFAPADDPAVVVAVMVDEPTPIYGGVVAAPVFREVMSVALAARRVPPDRTDESLDDLIGRAREEILDAASREGPAIVDGIPPVNGDE